MRIKYNSLHKQGRMVPGTELAPKTQRQFYVCFPTIVLLILKGNTGIYLFKKFKILSSKAN